jgi:hypothetical protein
VEIFVVLFLALAMPSGEEAEQSRYVCQNEVKYELVMCFAGRGMAPCKQEVSRRLTCPNSPYIGAEAP